jgi:hypothetical protein
MLPCPDCNQQISPGEKFCPNCGFRLKSPTTGRKSRDSQLPRASLTGIHWVDGILGFLLFWMLLYFTTKVPLIGDPVGAIMGGIIFFGLPLVLGLGLGYRAMALGYGIGFGALVVLFLELPKSIS